MNSSRKMFFAVCGLILVLCVWHRPSLFSKDNDEEKCEMGEKGSFTELFNVDKNDFASVGENPYFILKPGYKIVLEGNEDNAKAVLYITVLDGVKVVDGVETRIIEERETSDGRLVEISRNYFAISKRTNSVYYFGEDVDIYKDDKVVSHDGSWQSGVNGAKYGMMMPGDVLLGARYFEEMCPKVAMDRAEIVSVSEKVDTPAGKMEKCLKIKETSLTEKGKEYKYYAYGIGLIKEESLKLVKYGYNK